MDADVARDEQLYLWEEIMLPTGVSYGADGSLKAASLNKLVEKLTDRNAGCFYLFKPSVEFVLQALFVVLAVD